MITSTSLFLKEDPSGSCIVPVSETLVVNCNFCIFLFKDTIFYLSDEIEGVAIFFFRDGCFSDPGFAKIHMLQNLNVPDLLMIRKNLRFTSGESVSTASR